MADNDKALADFEDEDDIHPAHLVHSTEQLAAFRNRPSWIDMPFQPPETAFKGELEESQMMADWRHHTTIPFLQRVEMLDNTVTETNIYR